MEFLTIAAAVIVANLVSDVLVAIYVTTQTKRVKRLQEQQLRNFQSAMQTEAAESREPTGYA
jgi:mannitol-specific phosphotransferase system IIBC component